MHHIKIFLIALFVLCKTVALQAEESKTPASSREGRYVNVSLISGPDYAGFMSNTQLEMLLQGGKDLKFISLQNTHIYRSDRFTRQENTDKELGSSDIVIIPILQVKMITPLTSQFAAENFQK